jgi:DNA-binding response OmpR family regulator
MKSFKEVFELTKELNVLFIEDDTAFQRETAEVFENLFKKVDLAKDGADGILKYEEYYRKNQKHYDIIFTDINMPNIDGIEFTKKVYHINENQPIIVISAHNDSNYLLEFINLGIEQFLIKPLEYNRLLLTIYNASKKLLLSKENNLHNNLIELGAKYKWDKDKIVLLHNQLPITLTKNEIALMKILVEHNSKITTMEEIFQTLSYNKFEKVTLATIKSIISRLRKKISPLEIENIYGLGYKLHD